LACLFNLKLLKGLFITLFFHGIGLNFCSIAITNQWSWDDIFFTNGYRGSSFSEFVPLWNKLTWQHIWTRYTNSFESRPLFVRSFRSSGKDSCGDTHTERFSECNN